VCILMYRSHGSRHQSRLLALLLVDGVAVLVGESLLLHDLDGVVDGVQVGLGRSVRVPVVIGPGKVLAVVDSKVHVVQGVVSRAVDELFQPVSGNHVAIVDKDGPDLDENKENQVKVLLHGADVDEDATTMLAIWYMLY
jgi:hypothetical protein